MGGAEFVGGMLEDEAAYVACRSSLDLQRPHATWAAFERLHSRRQHRRAAVPGSAVPVIHRPVRQMGRLPTGFSRRHVPRPRSPDDDLLAETVSSRCAEVD